MPSHPFGTVVIGLLLFALGCTDESGTEAGLAEVDRPYAGSSPYVVIDPAMHHLRNGEEPEWSEFAESSSKHELDLSFAAAANASEYTLALTQYDVKQGWPIELNGQQLGSLERDEKKMVVYYSVPPGALRDDENHLRIFASGEAVDDVLVGRIVLVERPLAEVLTEATVHVEVVSAETGAPMPARITITDAGGALQTVAPPFDVQMTRTAVRPGFVYTGNGTATLSMPAGTYTLYAGRGFEYGVDSTRLTLEPGADVSHRFVVAREVQTEGWISSDTHVHTLTYSGHGDATAEERVLTIAGEGLDLPVMADHNVHIDLEPVAVAMGVRRYFTPVVGNEYTTEIGHFNYFSVSATTPVPDTEVKDWIDIADRIGSVRGADVVVLNHARGVHRGFRPFGSDLHIGVAGLNRDGWQLPANAMEVINSGAQQTDMMQLFRDWFGKLNAGKILAPVGSSDSHDVARFIVGQARTFVRARSDDPGSVDVDEVVQSIRDGRVGVSLGLMADIRVDEAYGPGDLAPVTDSFVVHVRVLGPSWTKADSVVLYQNGERIREAAIEAGEEAGVKWSGGWTLARPHHDVHLVAIAFGPGDTPVFWPIAKPYQPDSPEWHPHVIGATGAVWIDADGDGRRSAARDYAEELVAEAEGDAVRLAGLLESFDEAVAVQAAALLHQRDELPAEVSVFENAAPATHRGFAAFMNELRDGI